MSWSEEQVIALSPDDASTKSGKDLAKPEKWVSLNKNENALWGECKGSGSKPYQTQIDLNNIAFKCSCPSRKFPCKHGLGLLLLFSRTSNSFSEAEAPSWVSEWLTKRAQREEKKTEKVEQPVDKAAQAKRQQARQGKVNDGIEELLVWIKDIIRNGIVTIPEKSPSYWEGMSKRLVDAQAPGLARMVQNLGSVNFFAENWQSEFLDQLLRIYLVIKGFQNHSSISSMLLEDIKSHIGFTQNQEELKAQSGITDTWLVLSKQTNDEGSLTTERYWLYGNKSKKYALILQFIANGQGKNITLSPGMSIEAELVYFPSVSPLRALIKRQISSDTAISPEGLSSWRAVAENESNYNALLPFGGEIPFIIDNVRLIMIAGNWHLSDAVNETVLVNQFFKSIYKLLAISGGEPVKLAVTGKENKYEPIGVWCNDNYYIL